MDQKEPVDVAREPVDLNDDSSFMDTGILHDQKHPCICVGMDGKHRKTCEKYSDGS